VVPQRAGLLLVAALQPPLLAETKRKELVRARLAPEGPAFLLELEAASAVIRRLIPGRVVLPATSALAPAPEAPEAGPLEERPEVAPRVEAPAEEVEEEVVAAVTLEALPAVASLLEAVAAEEARLAAEDQLQLEVQLVCL
jgi:hypothetical protein